MTPNLLDVLACPRCRGALSTSDSGPQTATVAVRKRNDHLPDGPLRCACGATFAVRSLIPRMVGDVNLESRFRMTLRSYSDWWERVQKGVSHGLDNDAILRARTGLTPDDVRGRVVLDAGCGDGRIAGVLCDWGAAMVVALDLGRGVDRARALLGDRPNLHLVQGSILDLPFRPESFDVVVSLGVLHHTPDTRAAFAAAAELVQVGGRLAVYLYKRDEFHFGESELYAGAKLAGNALYQEPLRRLIAALPHRAILGWSRLMTRKRVLLDRLARRRITRPVARGLEFVMPYDIHKPLESREFNAVRNYDHYSTRFLTRHTRQEVVDWFQEEGFDDIDVLPYPTSVRGVKTTSPRDPVTVTLWRVRSIEEIEARGIEKAFHA